MNHILIVEDDKGLNNGIALTLKQDDYVFYQAYTLEEGRKYFGSQDFDLIILDINLPDGSGLDLCREIRRTTFVPILFLTANDMELDIVTGFESGGDDYMTKPFSLMVLRARVAALLRRSKAGNVPERVEIQPFRFDFTGMEYYRNDEQLELSKTEQKLLKLLVDNRGQVLERAVLVDYIWTDGARYVDENALSVTVNRLRSKLEDTEFIETVYGVGYRWKK